MVGTQEATGISHIMNSRFFLLAIISGLLLSACGSEGGSSDVVDSQPANSIELESSRWQLVELVALGGHSFIPEDPADYTLNFRPEGRLTGKSDCNTFTADWAVAGGSLTFANYNPTRSLCIRGSLHNYYSLYLRDVTGVSAEGDGLALVTSTPDVRLVFQAVAE